MLRGVLAKRRVARVWLIPAACLLGSAWVACGALAQTTSEYELKAAFIYNFAKFVEWPPESFSDADAPIVIDIAGDDGFRDLLARTVDGKLVQGRKIVVKSWNQRDAPHGCHILFLSSSLNGPAADVLAAGKGEGVLTIGEADGFARDGGIINFVLIDRKLGFEINNKRAENVGLKISSKLLSLAKNVWE